MGWGYRTFVRPLLFERDSEEIHELTLSRLNWASRNEWAREVMRSFCGAEALPVELFGLRFPNPVGLAAGMDKRAVAVPAWEALGFGFVELGGVTWHAQPGNPAPRMFRLVEDGALINRMGFNNPGAEAVAARLREWRESGRWPAHPVGINLGKSKITPNESAAEDYAASFRALWELADFFVVNVSSPNTPNLRQLQDRGALDAILSKLQEINLEIAGRAGGEAKPLLVKVAPDLEWEALDEIVDLAEARDVAGLVATNTTVARPDAREAAAAQGYAESGGLSGRPLRERSTEVVRHLFRASGGKLPIIGVGGIFNAEDAWEKITAGASLVQVYTGLVFEGPALARDIVSGLRERLEREGRHSLREAVGVAA